MRRAVVRSLGVVLLGVFAGAGCGGGGSASGGGNPGGGAGPVAGTGEGEAAVTFATVGFVPAAEVGAWWAALNESVQRAADERGVKVVRADATGDAAAQVAAVRGFVEQGVDAIVLVPVAGDGWGSVLKDAAGAGIPVVLVGREEDAPDGDFATLVTWDFAQQGYLAAEWIGNEAGEEGAVIELKGAAGDGRSAQRAEGFAKAMTEFPQMRVVASVSGGTDRVTAKEALAGLLGEHGEGLTAVFAHDDELAAGAIEALAAAELAPGDDVIVASVGGTKGAFDAILGEKQNCTVDHNALVGPAVFGALEQVFGGVEEVPERTVVEDPVFDLGGVLEARAGREY